MQLFIEMSDNRNEVFMDGKRIVISAAVLLWAIVIAVGIRETVWHFYEPPEDIGSRIITVNSDPGEIAKEWFQQYTDRLKGWKVPFEYRISSAEIDQTEVLTDLGDHYVQIDYTVKTVSVNDQIVQNLELTGTEKRRVYTGQMVLHFLKNNDGSYTLNERMRPVQYQMLTPQFQEERNTPQTQHYKMNTEEPMTYYISDSTLYVTYDSGEHLIEVPDGYESVCAAANGTYNELLNDNSYVVTEEFTAFVAGNNLLYSTDCGKTWELSHITDRPSIAKSFLSKTDSGVYVTIAVDRSLGNDYYGTFYSSDFITWVNIRSKDGGWVGLDCSFWTAADIGYYAEDDSLFVTKDQGTTWQEAVIPEAEEVTAHLGFNPFDTVEQMYEAEGVFCLVLGQGDDGDYMRNGVLMEAFYKSEDGINFLFVKEIEDDTPEEAG